MAAIPISDETIKRFQQDGIPGGDPTAPPAADDAEATRQLNEAVGWLLKTADSALRNVDDRLGTEPESVERISELSVLVAKRNISEDILRNSPELFLGTIIAGLAIEKSIVFSQIKKEKAQGNQESEKKQDPDNE